MTLYPGEKKPYQDNNKTKISLQKIRIYIGIENYGIFLMSELFEKLFFFFKFLLYILNRIKYLVDKT